MVIPPSSRYANNTIPVPLNVGNLKFVTCHVEVKAGKRNQYFNPYCNNYVVGSLLNLKNLYIIVYNLHLYTNQSTQRNFQYSRNIGCYQAYILFCNDTVLNGTLNSLHQIRTYTLVSKSSRMLTPLSMAVFIYRPHKASSSYENISRRNGNEAEFSVLTLIIYCHLSLQ